ncbi:hypothetical protein [Aquiflexum sp.]|uniref:hypothetical protein n=1 Tax=Aquiflexum sp. TaxID=1872584 RepID=UPI00359466A0
MLEIAMLFEANLEVLEELEDMLKQIAPKDFTDISPVLKSSSIGQHSRHIIELYNCLLDQYDHGVISYDSRKRNTSIESDIAVALSHIQNIPHRINKPDKNLTLMHRIGGKDFFFESSYFREVWYNLEHCIHHQALIKLACLDLGYIQLPETFGFASSTLAFRKWEGG